jgi:mannose-1-phosphate guanylyltransferase/phosphomannomutase
MKAVIMAGGFGTRIQPLTSNIPKPMIPLANRPIMLHILELLKKHGITDLVMLLYHQPDVIKNFFREGTDFGVKIEYVTPMQDMGTAGAVKCAEKYLDERFLVISGDLLTDFNLKKIIDFHAENKALATITLTPVKDPLQFGVVITDKHKRITQFLEKPGWGEVISDTINTGIYVLEPEIFQFIPEGENFDFSQNLFPFLLENKYPLFGYPIKGYWRDIGNTDSYREAHHDIFRGRTNIRIDEQKLDFLGKDLRVGSEVTFEDSSTLDGTVILGDNTQILGSAHIKDSVIGRNCTIEAGARLFRCVIWDNVYIRKGAKITDAVICNNVSIGQSVTIEEGVIVADDTSIGEEAFIKRDVKIWPKKLIESGATVSGNLIWGEKWKKTLFEGAMIKGLTNIELTPEFMAKLGCAYGSTLPKGSYVLAGRDANRSSRMLKRSFLGGILSTGINVRDLKMMPLPIMRYKLKTFGEVGGIQFRQGADEGASTEIIFLDADGIDFSSSMGKNVERIYYKENFRRAHYTEPGGISELPNVIDFYREGFLRSIDRNALKGASFKVVIDFNYCPASQILPALLNDLGCEVIALNAYVEEERGSRITGDKSLRLQQISKIVTALEAKAGFLLEQTTESIILVDETGKECSPVELLSLAVSLMLRKGEKGVFVVPVPAPSVIERMAHEKGCVVHRTKSSERGLIEASLSSNVILAGSIDGRFAFPVFQNAFDGMYAIAKIIELVGSVDLPVSKCLESIPFRSYVQAKVPCIWEMKGSVMRRMSEDSMDKEAVFIDGIKINFGEDWVLVLPDQYQPFIHIISESKDESTSRELLKVYREKIETWKKESA